MGRFASRGVDAPAAAAPAAGLPLGRWGEPEEIAGPLVFLVSKLSSFMSGQTLVADGGMRAHFPHGGTNPMRKTDQPVVSGS